MSETPYPTLLKEVLAGRSLSFEQAHEAFGDIMDGLWSEARIAGLLVALAVKGESTEEIAAAATAMREHVVPVDTGGAEVMDTCGTGGTGLRTFNISTCAAMVAAACGVRTAKHGNRTNTRASGSADVLDALGVNLDAEIDVVARCLHEAGVCFCFAVRHHPAMRYAVPVRKQLGVRTIFNLLGPLTNPAGARRQLLGVFEDGLTGRLARVLQRLGSERAMVVHARDGLDELSTCSPTRVCELRDGELREYELDCREVGLEPASMDELLVESPGESAEAIRAVLAGEHGARRDIVLLNAAGVLYLAGKAERLADGIGAAAEAIDTGRAAATLERLIQLSHAG